ECQPAWEGNSTNNCFVAFAWEGPSAERWLVAVNYAPNQSQCRVRLPLSNLAGKSWRLTDRLGSACYDRDGNALQSSRLSRAVPPCKAHVFTVASRSG